MTIRCLLTLLLLSAVPLAAESQSGHTEQAAAEAPDALEPEPTEGPMTEGPETPELLAPGPEESAPVEPVPSDETDEPEAPDPNFVGPPEPPLEAWAAEPEAEEGEDGFIILGKKLEPGELRQFNWQLETAMAGLAVPMPVLVAHGRKAGSTLCLVAAVHGDELNGVEIVRRIMFDIDLDKLAGNVVGVPIANAFGFLRSSRYLPDRRDLNRFFPGNAGGSMASRFAHALFTEVISRCGVLIDIHTGSFYRTNLPQLRADLTIPSVLELSRQFGDIAVLHDVGPAGSLRRAATDAGIPAVTMETGGPARFQEGAVNAGVRAIEALLNHLGMIKRFRLFGEPQPVIYDSTWVRVESGGILLTDVKLGETVEQGQRLGTVTDPIQNKRQILEAPFRGRLLGMAVNQVVMPGFAAFHIGRAASEKQAIESTAMKEDQPDAEHSDDDGTYAFEDELFEPSTATTDEPEPEQPPEPTTPDRTEGEDPTSAEPPDLDEQPGESDARRQEELPTLPGTPWLPDLLREDPRVCIHPPLAACANTGFPRQCRHGGEYCRGLPGPA